MDKDIQEIQKKFDEFIAWFTTFENRLNKRQEAKIPTEDTPMGARVRARDAECEIWTHGRFICARQPYDEYPFKILTDAGNIEIFVHCEIEEVGA